MPTEIAFRRGRIARKRPFARFAAVRSIYAIVKEWVRPTALISGSMSEAPAANAAPSAVFAGLFTDLTIERIPASGTCLFESLSTGQSIEVRYDYHYSVVP